MADVTIAECETPELEGQSAPTSCSPKASGPSSSGASQGHHFLDLLALGALACNAPIAILSVHTPSGWNTLAYGAPNPVASGLKVDELVQRFAASSGPVEIEDLLTNLPDSPLLRQPFGLRWAYGSAIADAGGRQLGVVVILDRWAHQVTRREHRALGALVRQLGFALGEVRASPPAAAAPAVPAAPARAPRVKPPKAPVDGPLLRSPEVAALFDVSERTVLNWAHAGKLPSLRTIGGHLRFRREDVIALLDNA